MRTLEVSLELLEALAPDEAMNQDEQGGCVWCGGRPGEYGYAGRDPKDHEDDCPWIKARDLIEKLTYPREACVKGLSDFGPDWIVVNDYDSGTLLELQKSRCDGATTPGTRGLLEWNDRGKEPGVYFRVPRR